MNWTVKTKPTSIKPIRSLIIPGTSILNPPAQIITRNYGFIGLYKYPFNAAATPNIPSKAVAQINIISRIINI